MTNRKIHNEGHVRKVRSGDIRETPHIARRQLEPCCTADSREKDEREKEEGRGHLRRIEDFYTPFVDSDRRIPRRSWCVATKIILS